MSFVAHRVYSTRINPAIVEIEECAHGDRVIDRFIGIANVVQRLYIAPLDVYRIVIHFPNKAQQRFFRFGQRRRFEIRQNARHQFFVPKQFRRDRGVRFRSKRAVI